MLENLLIVVIVAVAAFFVGRRLFNAIKGGKCGGCCGCDTATNKSTGCDKTAADFPRRHAD